MKYFVFIILSVSVLISVRTLFQSGYFPMHDDAQVARVVVMKKALLDHQFPVRFVSDLGYGYGYPLFEFYAPLPYYVGGGIALTGVDSVVATKAMMILGILVGATGIFIVGKIFFGLYGGLLSALAFTFFPYRAVQLFVRGSIGELWATSFLPFVIAGYYLIFRKETRVQGTLMGVFGLTGIFLSHTILGLVTTLAVIAYLFAYALYRIIRGTWDSKIFLSFTAVLLVSFGLSAFFLIPAFFEMGATNVGSVVGPTADFRRHFVCIAQFWSSPWGFGGSTDTCIDGLSFRLGKMHIAALVVSIMTFIGLTSHRWKKEKVLWYLVFVFSFIASLFFILSISQPIWESFSYLSFVQYPWRLLSFTGVFVSLLVGALGDRKSPFVAKVFGGICVSMIVWSSVSLFQPQYTYEKPTAAFEESRELRFRASGVSDEYLPKDFIKPTRVEDIPQYRVPFSDAVDTTIQSENSISGEYDLTVTKDTELTLNLAYFPGWKFAIDGKEVHPRIERAKPIMVLSEGNHHVSLRFEDTPVRRAANVVTLTTIVLILLLLYGKKRVR